MAALTDSVVKAELDQLDRLPVSDEERNTEDDASPIEMTEDWVRLYVALRRGSGGQPLRLSASHLRRWRARVVVHDCEAESLHSQASCLGEVGDLPRGLAKMGDPAGIVGSPSRHLWRRCRFHRRWSRPLEAQCAKFAPFGGCRQMGPRALQRPPQGWGR